MKICERIVIGIALVWFLMLSSSRSVNAIENVRVLENGTDSMTIVWTAQPGEKSFDVTASYFDYKYKWKIKHGLINGYSTTGTEVTACKLTTSASTVKLTNLKGGEKVFVYIVSYDEEGYYLDDGNYTFETLPGKMEIKNPELIAYVRGLDVNTGKVNQVRNYMLNCYYIVQHAADGYEAQLFNRHKKKIYTCKQSAKYSNLYISGLSDSLYYFRMRAYKKINGKKYYGAWSDKRAVILQPTCQARQSNKGLQIRWNKIQGATGYDVYVSGSTSSGSFKKVLSVKKGKTNVVIKKYEGKKFKRGKTYYYYVLAKKKTSKGIIESARMYKYFRVKY